MSNRMSLNLMVLMALLSTQTVAAESSTPKNRCILTSKLCKNYPHFNNAQFKDNFGEQFLDVSRAAGPCLRRAEDFHHWCANGRGDSSSDEAMRPTIAATHISGKSGKVTSQIYLPDACDKDWSLFGKHCYIHVWKKRDWSAAEHYCNSLGGHLCSIHGKEENEFVFTLTHGLSSWIGYHDSFHKEEKKEWTDNSKTDFENMATNCTGRESEPECSREEVAQKWYNVQHDEGSTWVCKKEAKKYPLSLIRNTTALETLPNLDWLQLRYDEDLILRNLEEERRRANEGILLDGLTEEEKAEEEMRKEKGKIQPIKGEKMPEAEGEGEDEDSGGLRVRRRGSNSRSKCKNC